MGLLYHASQRELDRDDIIALLNLHKPPTVMLMDDLSDLKWTLVVHTRHARGLGPGILDAKIDTNEDRLRFHLNHTGIFSL